MNKQPETRNNETIFLRYSREERLKHASKTVQHMYEPDYIKRSGILKSLTATRASRSILFVIVTIVILTFFSAFLKREHTKSVLHGIPIRLEMLAQEDTLYSNIIMSGTEQKESCSIPIHIVFAVFNSDNNQCGQKIVDCIYIGSPLRIPVQFQCRVSKVQAAVSAKGKTITLSGTVP